MANQSEPPQARPLLDLLRSALKSAIAFLVAGLVLGSALPAAATDTPSFAPVNSKTTWRLTTCSWDCPLRDLLEGDRHRYLVIPLHRTGPPDSSVLPVNPYLSLQGEHSGQTLMFAGTAITYAAPGVAGAPDILTIDLGDQIQADHYTGSLVTQTSTQADPVAAPVDLQVRNSPTGAIVVLVLAVAAGFGLTRLLDQQPKADFVSSAQKLLDKIRGLPDSERRVLVPLWNQLWNERGSQFETAQTHLKSLYAGTDALRKCRNAQDEALRYADLAKLTPWVQRIGGATNRVVTAVQGFTANYDDSVRLVWQAQREASAAHDLNLQVNALVVKAAPAQGTGQLYTAFLQAAQDFRTALAGVSPDPTQAAQDLNPLFQNVKNAFDALEASHPLPPPVGAPVAAGVGGVGALIGFLGWPARTNGDTDVAAQRSFDLGAAIAKNLGPVGASLVFLVLLVIGLKTSYLDNAVFGSTWSDWAALVIWGLAAYGTRKTLTGIGASAVKSAGKPS